MSPGDPDATIRSAKVLLVGGAFGIRKVIRNLLLSVGVTDVHDAAEAETGLATIAALDPDVVILDWHMPEMSGAEFVRRLRGVDGSPSSSVPIIMLADHSAPARVAEAMRLGVREFLAEPVSGPALRERLASVLTNTPPRRLTVAPNLQPREEGDQGDVDGPSDDAIVAN